MLQAVRALDGKKKMEKWSYLSSFHVSFLSYGPQIVEKSAFFQFCADLSNKPSSVRANYIYVSEISHYTLSENDLAIKISKTIVAQQKFKKTLQLQTLISPKQ